MIGTSRTSCEFVAQIGQLLDVLRLGLAAVRQLDAAARLRIAQPQPQREELRMLGAVCPQQGPEPVDGVSDLGECRGFVQPYRSFDSLGRGQFVASACRAAEKRRTASSFFFLVWNLVSKYMPDHQQRTQRYEHHA